MAGSSSRGEQFASAIDNLLRHCPELEAVAVISFDGAPLVTALPEHIDERRVAATIATLFEFAEHAASLLTRGNVTAVHLGGETGSVYVVPAGDRALLVTLVESGIAAEAIDLDVRRSASRIAEILAVGADEGSDTMLEPGGDDRDRLLLAQDVDELPFDDAVDRLQVDDVVDQLPLSEGEDISAVDDPWPYSGRDLGLVTEDHDDGGSA